MTAMTGQGAQLARPARRFSWSWLGLTPFFLLAIMFIGLPVSYLIIGSFQGLDGQPTLQNYADLWSPTRRARAASRRRGTNASMTLRSTKSR